MTDGAGVQLCPMVELLNEEGDQAWVRAGDEQHLAYWQRRGYRTTGNVRNPGAPHTAPPPKPALEVPRIRLEDGETDPAPVKGGARKRSKT